MFAAVFGHLRCVQFLYHHMGPGCLRVQNHVGHTLWSLACKHQQLECKTYLASLGVRLRPQTMPVIRGAKLLEDACDGAPQSIRRALCHGARLNVRDEDGNTILILAAWYGHRNVMALAIHSGCNVAACNHFGWTAAMVCVLQNRPHLLDLVLQSCNEFGSVAVPQRNATGQTVLLLAAKFGYVECLKVAIARGADVHSTDCQGRTPIILATLGGHVAALRYLVTLTPRWTAMDASYCTAKDYAQRRQHHECEQLLTSTLTSTGPRDGCYLTDTVTSPRPYKRRRIGGVDVDRHGAGVALEEWVMRDAQVAIHHVID